MLFLIERGNTVPRAFTVGEFEHAKVSRNQKTWSQ
jgi:hypothetical protein